MTEHPAGDHDRPTDTRDVESVLLSDAPTVDLIAKAKQGDEQALGAVLERCLPPLTRWAHGRLPPTVRESADTTILVRQAVSNMLIHLDRFEPREHVGAMQAYLRQSVLNDIRSRLRIVARRDLPRDQDDGLVPDEADPLDQAIAQQSFERYRAALARLRVRDRELIVARIESEWTFEEIRDHFAFRTTNAVRLALARALRRLRAILDGQL
jgi:RNA polymerase sigma-70 factor (ECF subfamily)